MLKTRRTEERIIALYRQGRIVGGVYAGRGVEGTTVGAGLALEAQDWLFPIHRDLGAHLAKGQSVLNILLQYLGRGTSLSRGKDSGIHCSDPRLNIVGNVSHLGHMIPVAVGTAIGMRMQGHAIVTLNFIGEGGSNIGDFHEGLNFAAVQKAPFVLVIENNQYAYSTPTHKGFSARHLSDRADGYGIPGHHIDGTDALQVYATVKEAIERARAGAGPSLIECLSFRMVGHSAHDDAFYVDKKQMKAYEKKDPIARLEHLLLKEGVLDAPALAAIDGAIAQEIEEATRTALESPLPEADWAAEGLYAE
ncbi:MAG TPA: thiamine pyrophosphate-dependent dehydrogenase E1 component subunit alpha [bacterium]|nr:thiamine pyrophosphate-dependent dehydrogenase E1 component subunit alpha [bacterium]HPR88380.1 thiamine pyrophosphate-dependent dehydrogenase E1 component subunit alpha [bacterium]